MRSFVQMVQFMSAKMFSLGLTILCSCFLLKQSFGALSSQLQHVFQYETHPDQLSGAISAYRLYLD